MKIRPLALAACAALLFSAAVTLPAQAHDRDPYFGPVMSRQAFYNYVYYPNEQVYFAPQTRRWFWYRAGYWQSGFNLPFALNLRFAGIPIQLSSGIPYQEHRYVEEHYGRPWHRVHDVVIEYRDNRPKYWRELEHERAPMYLRDRRYEHAYEREREREHKREEEHYEHHRW